MKVVGGRVCARCRTTVGTSLVGLCSVIFAVVVVLKKEVGSWDLSGLAGMEVYKGKEVKGKFLYGEKN